jgi:SAM-dependent methyltransferase
MPRLQLPPEGALRPNDAHDPLPYYYRSVVGSLFRARLDTGLRLLEGRPRFGRLLALGYGSGLLLPTLSTLTDELWGSDLVPEPSGLREALGRLGVHPTGLVQADVRALPFEEGFFDGVVAFGILAHLRANELVAALGQLARVLRPGGLLLVGCPAVQRAMNAAFSAIGFAGIEEHHFSGIGDVARNARPHFTALRRATLPSLMQAAPLGWAPYTSLLLQRR